MKKIGRRIVLSLLFVLPFGIADTSVAWASQTKKLTSTTTTTLGSGAARIYVADEGRGQAMVYDPSIQGDQSPLQVFQDPAHLRMPSGMVYDSKNDELIVTHSGEETNEDGYATGTGSVSVYARSTLALLRTLAGPSTGILGAAGVVVDTVNNELIIADREGGSPSIRVFSRMASGDVVPLRTIHGDKTGIKVPKAIGFDQTHGEIFLADRFSIRVFSRTASGNVAPLRVIEGPNTGFGGNPYIGAEDLVYDPVHEEIIVLRTTYYNGPTPSVFVFPRTANGNVAPTRTISGPKTGIEYPLSLAVDSANGEILVTHRQDRGVPSSILVFPRMANGDVAPIRKIQGSSTSLDDSPSALVVDPVHNEIFTVGHDQHLLVAYPRTATGNVAPLRMLIGGIQKTYGPAGIAIDAVHQEMFLSESGRILVYSLKTPNAPPVRQISGDLTGLTVARGLAVDPVNNEIYVAELSQGGEVFKISVFPRLSSGNIAPVRVIEAPPDQSPKIRPTAMALDLIHNELWVVHGVTDSIVAFPRTANGNAVPVRAITTNEIMTSLDGIAYDPVHEEVVVADSYENAVFVFSRVANGEVAPLRKLQGEATQLREPWGVAVNPATGEILVANKAGQSITTYARLANGNVAPLRILSGVNTGLSEPVAVVLP